MSVITSTLIIPGLCRQAFKLAFRPSSLTTSFSTTSCQMHDHRHRLTPTDSKIGFIGTGKIAQSIIQAIIKKNIIRPENIYASEINKEYLVYLKERCEVFQVILNVFKKSKLSCFWITRNFFKKYKINFEDNSSELLKKVDNVLICVKPSDFFNLLTEISSKIEKKHLILSIAAAIKLGQIEEVSFCSVFY